MNPMYDIFTRWKIVEEKKKRFFKPSVNCKDNREKNIWITGSKEQLEMFIDRAVGTDPSRVYNFNKYWDGYAGQPVIVVRLYRRYNMDQRIARIKELGEFVPIGADTSKGRLLYADLQNHGFLNPMKYHCIILSTMTPEEACKDLDPRFKHHDLTGLKWRYDVMTLSE